MSKILIVIIIVFCFSVTAQADNYTTKEICDNIYIIEGGDNTKYPYGIKSVKCNGKQECETICHNTINNNRKRFKEYGYKEYQTFLDFLASRYCPLSENLCENWLPNLKYFLTRP